MKQWLFLLLLIFNFTGREVISQITSPQVRAAFGVDGELRSNFFNTAALAANDDWYKMDAGTGIGVIDTTGVAAQLALYNSNINSRFIPLMRGMSVPLYSNLNNKTLIDAVFVRDHHGNDSSSFSGGNKNGMSPANWSCPVSQSVPDKSEILDMYMHVRRDGTSTTDSLWFFGGLSLGSNQGNRYFDFEMYQTNIQYNTATQTFSGFGSEAGHTAWLFDAAGKVIRPGDIIFTAEYSSSALSNLEARIWVHQSTLSTTPAAFNWGGAFDGDGTGAVYGYANIVPKTSGAFYTGLQCAVNAWTGAFQLIQKDNSMSTTYDANQFMEFSVNLSKLGLDPLMTLNDACALPFRRLMVKSRSSISFNAELKDFVCSFTFFNVPAADVTTGFPSICPGNVSAVWVTNAIPTSTYTWQALGGGNIVGSNTGSSINIDQSGTYVVSQYLMNGCTNVYARDTIAVNASNSCFVLNQHFQQFSVRQMNADRVAVSWSSQLQGVGAYFELEKSEDGKSFYHLESQAAKNSGLYHTTDDISNDLPGYVYYRVKFMGGENEVYYSEVQLIKKNPTAGQLSFTMAPNPATHLVRIKMQSQQSAAAELLIRNEIGMIVYRRKVPVQTGANEWRIERDASWRAGIYMVELALPNEPIRKRLLLQ